MMTLSLLHLVASVTVIFTAAVTVGNCQLQITTFGECQPEKTSCRECYLELVRAVLGRDGNVFNLSQMFTPPTFDHPSFVTVNYRFFNECNNNTDFCVDEIHTWFWAKSGAYFLHPLATFQFISLFFGNAQPIYEREVYVTLDATECYGVNSDHVTLLTQRLKIYIQEQSFYPKMDNEYLPVAANSTTIAEILGNSPYTRVSLSAEHILFLCPLFVTIIILSLMMIVLMLYACGGLCKFKSSVKASLKNHTKATILAFTVASFNRILIFLALDIAALAFRFPCSDPKVEAICEFSNLMYNTPGALLAYDLFSLLFFVASIVVAILTPKLFIGLQNRGGMYQNFNPNSNSNHQSIRHIQYFCCTLAAMGFVFSCLMHSPYVIMAYLSDAHYATSILVYYTTVLFIEFGIVQYTFRVYFDMGSFIHKRKKLTGLLVFVQTLLIYCLVLSASFFFYFIPVSNTVTNLPNEGIIVYQTALILLGAFITYKALFKSKKSEQDKHSLNLYQLSRQLKEREIAELNIKVKNDKHHKTLKGIMENKILHLQKEITLMHIKHKITCLTNGSNDTIHPVRIARLKRQQNEIIFYLKSEAHRLKDEISRDQLNPPNQQDQPDQPDHPVIGLQPEQPNQNNKQAQQQDQVNEQGEQDQNLHNDISSYKQEEMYRLNCEILDHMLAMKFHLEERFHNQDDINAITREISTLKTDICQHLNEKKNRLNQEQPQTTEILEQISSIEEEIVHLDKVCSSQQYDGQQRGQHRGNNNNVHEEEIQLVPINGQY